MNTQNEKTEVALREEEILAFWQEHDIFKKSLEKDSPEGDYTFYDGPPFATGLPHYGHLLAGTLKDAIPRFWTMNGYRVRRKWGWDCHGLPLENLIEKKLGLGTKRDIEEYGVQKFNEAARDAVMEYADDWRRIVPRMGRFVDMDDDYRTMDASYTESVWWSFSELHKKGLVYEGFKSMHLCPRCGTTLSNFEVNQGYKDIKDISVYVKMHLKSGQKYGPSYETKDSAYIVVWTTTPWTLPGNVAVAVHKDAVYVAVRVDGIKELLIIAKDNLEQVLSGHEVEIVHDDIKGSDLVGLEYTPPFDYLKQKIDKTENAWKVWHADYVELGEEGTGAVHIAPAYGEDDMLLAQDNDIPIVHHVGEDGRFLDFVTDFAGTLVKPKDDEATEISHLDTDIEIVRALAKSGHLFRKENVTHSYPHCWRCDTPLLNYGTTSWFVKVTDLKDDLIAENNEVVWVPEHVGKNRFGKWLENARDWAISRQRYWGAPLPIWKNPETKEHKVFGSLEELQEYVPKSGNTFFITRHGESEFNTKGILSAVNNGDTNGVTEKGKEQIDTLAEGLKEVDYIYHSPLNRTTLTAQLVAEKLGVAKERLIVDERLREMEFGAFEGKTPDEYHAFFGDGVGHLTKNPEGGESWGDVKRRVGDFLYDINTKHENQRILIVSHNGTLQMLQAVAQGDEKETLGTYIEEDHYDMKNAELRELPFTPMPHNDDYELDFHRPYIDDIDLFEDGVRLERVPDVFDCWYESGSMSYAQQHYPFENTDVFEPKEGRGYPAEFIAESIDQTRGWFYSMLVLGTALFGKSPYKHVVTNGLVLAEDGKKMSKSLQNYPDPVDLVERLGADTMRFYLLSSPIIRGEDLNFSEKGVQELERKNIGRLHNVLAMYQMYADGTTAKDDSTHVLDRWIISRLNELIADVTNGFKNYELDKATRPITDFIDDLSVWYLRRSRDRIKGEDKEQTLATLRHVLKTLALVMAPSMPFYAEYLWREVKEDSDAESAHLADWPLGGDVDADINAGMEFIRTQANEGLRLRSEKGINVRQPLATFTVASPEIPRAWEQLQDILAEELNVKAVLHEEGKDSCDFDWSITPALKLEGDAREFMRTVQGMRKQADLEPQDRIKLIVQTSDGGEEVLKVHDEDIRNVVGAEEITLGDAEGEEITFGEHSATVQMVTV
ncbi:class I tRNA ligase family protein [Candidatus Kaiserbacteria bacterium]|nr:class I tRNA ligase family protein [Candidatus Kaiserbacteria bacterium]